MEGMFETFLGNFVAPIETRVKACRTSVPFCGCLNDWLRQNFADCSDSRIFFRLNRVSLKISFELILELDCLLKRFHVVQF